MLYFQFLYNSLSSFIRCKGTNTSRTLSASRLVFLCIYVYNIKCTVFYIDMNKEMYGKSKTKRENVRHLTCASLLVQTVSDYIPAHLHKWAHLRHRAQTTLTTYFPDVPLTFSSLSTDMYSLVNAEASTIHTYYLYVCVYA